MKLFRILLDTFVLLWLLINVFMSSTDYSSLTAVHWLIVTVVYINYCNTKDIKKLLEEK